VRTPATDRKIAFPWTGSSPSALIARKLVETRIVTVASPAYLKKACRPIHPSELEQGNHRLIEFRDPQTGRAYEWAFRQGRKEIEINSNAFLE